MLWFSYNSINFPIPPSLLNQYLDLKVQCTKVLAAEKNGPRGSKYPISIFILKLSQLLANIIFTTTNSVLVYCHSIVNIIYKFLLPVCSIAQLWRLKSITLKENTS